MAELSDERTIRKKTDMPLKKQKNKQKKALRKGYLNLGSSHKQAGKFAVCCCDALWSSAGLLVWAKLSRQMQRKICQDKPPQRLSSGNTNKDEQDLMWTVWGQMSPSYTGFLQRLLSAWPELTRVSGWDCFCGQRGKEREKKKKKVWKVFLLNLCGRLSDTLIGFAAFRWKTERPLRFDHGCGCGLTVKG